MPQIGAITILFIPLLISPLLGGQVSTTVASTRDPAWGRVRLVEEMRLGSISGPEEYALGQVRGLAVGHDEAIFVLDRQGPIVRMYNRDGVFVRNVGRTGEGPGEYSNIGGIQTLADGSLAIWDQRLRRISLFDPTGTFKESFQVPLTSALNTSNPMFYANDGQSYFILTGVPASPRRAGVNLGWLRVASTGHILDTIYQPASQAPVVPLWQTPNGSERPFVPWSFQTVTPLGDVVSGSNDAYVFQIQKADGRRIRVERAYTRP